MARASIHERLRKHALTYPGAWEDMPWSDDVVAKVGKKIFVFFGSGDRPGVTVKLPESADQALQAPGAAPSGYGLGRWGWVTVPLGKRGSPAVGVVEDWIDESYRTIAPKKLVAELDARTQSP